MGVDVFGNSGADTLNIGQPQPQQQSGGAAMPGGSGNPVIDALVQKLNQAQQLQQKTVLPQQMPPKQVGPIDNSGYMVNPSTSGGPGHNANVSMIQQIGNAVGSAINRHEQKEARDLSFDIQILQTSMDTVRDPNASPQDKALAQQQLNDLTGDKAKMKKIQKALNIQFFGGEDKRTNVEKQAVTMATKASQQGSGNAPQPGQGQPNTGQPGQSAPQGGETLGIPNNMQGLNPMAQQLMRRMPTQTGLSPAAIATAELTKSGVIPSAGDILKYASDQQYYKVLEDKMGTEAATKMAKIQNDYDTKMQDLAIKAKAEEDKNKQQEFLAQMRIEHEQAYERISAARIGLLQDQLAERIRNDSSNADLKKQNQDLQKLKTVVSSTTKEITDLTKQQVSVQKAVNSTFGWTDKGKQARQSLEDINKKLQDATTKQHDIIQQLDGTASSMGTAPPPTKDDAAFNSIWSAGSTNTKKGN